ncbi:ArsR/SmtB family transcription factor [Luteococcus sp. Sow4_B9]|uniref:ArsR/SmtB family transcription factor n=1 Tax=Luteococcus sp. Sow4_B9 TaxID=3438792 RepID=UPI003F9E42EC
MHRSKRDFCIETCQTSVVNRERPPLATPLAELAGVFKALGDETRLQLLLAVLDAGEAGVCVCNLPDLGLSQPTVSHHLRKLREAGLLESERRGTWVHYRATVRATDLAAAWSLGGTGG